MTAALSALAGCKCSEASKEKEQMSITPAYVQLAHDRFGDNAKLVENPTGEFVLIVSESERDQMNPHPKVTFFVYSKDQSEVTYESEVAGSVTWLDEYHLEVVVIPGIVRADSEPGGVTYRVDARSGSRVEIKAPSRRQ
ncbi:MAG TPA: hypothetical protein VMO47_13795 [Rhodothermales bacterium]|nr:hypothetical protein [Rhodothermales bacterium]